MKTFRFDALYTGKRWVTPGVISVDDQGKVQKISTQVTENDEKVPGWLIPGFFNAHSHAFQYAMAGLAEHATKGSKFDDFWSWREAMYDIALSISPEQLQSIATVAYAEMIRAGYTAVAEFHYLHHDPKGMPYQNPCEMGERLRAAAEATGIRLTLVPVFYRWGDFKKAASPKQKRFLFKSVDEYLKLFEAYGSHTGLGVHSLRASAPDETKAILNLKTKAPKHLHISEQEKEVKESKRVLKMTPIDWLVKNIDVGSNFYLVHATHATAGEIKRMIKAKANVVLCPSTEANLGDGFFPFEEFSAQKGRWCIGSDSHISLNPLEELRWLDYGTRLRTRTRNPNHPSGERGDALLAHATVGGLEIGDYLDGVVIDSRAPLFDGLRERHRISTLVFASDSSVVKGTLIGGKWRAREGRALCEISKDTAQVRSLRD